MSSLNKIILIGTVESDPQQRVTNSGDAFATFTLIVDRPERQDGAPSGQDAIDVVAWRDAAEKTQGLTQGASVMVEGRVVTRTTESEDGRKQWFTEVDAKLIRQLTGASESAGSAGLPEFDPQGSSLESTSSPELAESDFDFGGDKATDNMAAASEEPLAEESMEEEVPF